MRPDASLSDPSCKKYLEDLLQSVRKGLERARTLSTSSTSSNKSNPPLGTSTPSRPRPAFERTKSLDDDMRYT